MMDAKEVAPRGAVWMDKAPRQEPQISHCYSDGGIALAIPAGEEESGVEIGLLTPFYKKSFISK